MADCNTQGLIPELIQSPIAPCSLVCSPSRGQEQPIIDTTHTSPPLNSNEPGSWRKTLFPDLRHPKNFRLRFIPPTVRNEKTIGVCPKSAIEGELTILDLTLVGFILGRRPSFTFVRSALLKQWKLQGNVEIIQLLQGGYAFRFSDLRDRDNILEGDSYFVGGQPMFLRAWERSLHSGGVLGLRKIPLWISLPGLPLHLWGEEALSVVCSILGNPLYADKNTASKSRLAFARVCVEFTAGIPLLETITIEDDLGLTYEQKVTYEWRPPHCLSCGVFGHNECAIPEREMEKENLIREEDMILESVRKGEEELLAQKTGFLPTSLGRNFQESMKEVEDDVGWEQVRVRKKRPGLNGAPFSGQARPGSQSVKSVQHLVSKPQWRALNLSAIQVSPAEILPKVGLNLNSKHCTQNAPCPLTPSENAAGLGVEITPPVVVRPTEFVPNMEVNLNSIVCPQTEPGPLTLLEKNSYQNDKTTPPLQPLEKPSSRTALPCEPIVSGSSAGHTPFPNRITSMARELRRRQLGNPLLSITRMGSKSRGELSDCARKKETIGNCSSSADKGYYQNEHGNGMDCDESGKENQCMGRMSYVEKLKIGNETTNLRQMQEGCDLRKGESTHQSIPDSVEEGNGKGDAEEFESNMTNNRGSKGWKGKKVESGLGRADRL